MFDAMNNYQRVLLRDIAARYDGAFVDGPFGSNLKSHEYVESGVRLIQLQNIGDGYWNDENKKYITNTKFRSLARHGAVAGDIAIAKMADPVARACIVPSGESQYIVVADCIRLRVDETRFDPRYIVRAINSHVTRSEAEKKSIGSTRVRINLGALKTVGCLVPPLLEQHAIADVLDTLDITIRQTEAIIEKLKQVNQGLLHDILTRGIDASGELRPPRHQAPHLYRDSPLGWIPREWSLQPLAAICDLIRDGTHLPPARVESGPLLLSVRNMKDGRLVLTDQDTRVSEAFFQGMHKHWKIEVGDVLLAIVGATIGKVAVVGVLPRFTLQRSVAVLRGSASRLLNSFLYASMSHKRFQDALWTKVNQTAQPGIYLDQLGGIAICLPSLSEQRAAIECLSAVGARLDSERSSVERLRELKSGLVDDLLTGRVRVTPLLT